MMMSSAGPLVLAEESHSALRPAELRRSAQKRISSLVPSGFPLEDALIGLEEAYANVLEHAFSPGEPTRVRVEAYWDLRGLNFVLSDRGSRGGKLTFPRDGGGTVDSRRSRAAATGGSLGLYLVRRVMDCLSFEVSSGGVHRLSLIKFPHQENSVEEELLVELRAETDLARVNLKGYVNMDTSDYLAERIKEFVEREGLVRFLIDAQDLEYVSSSGVGVFIDLYDRYEGRGGRIAFFGLKPAVRRVLDLVGFMSFFGDFEAESEALASLRR